MTGNRIGKDITRPCKGKKKQQMSGSAQSRDGQSTAIDAAQADGAVGPVDDNSAVGLVGSVVELIDTVDSNGGGSRGQSPPGGCPGGPTQGDAVPACPEELGDTQGCAWDDGAWQVGVW